MDDTVAQAAATPPTVEDEEALPECCRTGFVISGTASGIDIEIGGIPTYLAKPRQPSKYAVLMLTDVFGYKFNNIRVLADALAGRSGYNVYVPDLFNGDAVAYETLQPFLEPAKTWLQTFAKPFRIVGAVPSVVLWMRRHSFEVTWPIIDKFLKALRESTEYAPEKLIAQGYCFGGVYSTYLGGTDLVDAYSTAHPGALKQEWIDNIKKPGLWQCAAIDRPFPPAKAKEVEANLAKKPHLVSVFKHYPGTTHGFCVRGDESDPVVNQAREQSTNDAVAFYKSVFEPSAA